MRRYSANADLALSAVAATNTYPLELVTGAAATAQIYDLVIFQDAQSAPQDGTYNAFLAQASAASAGSAVTPTPLDPNSGASIASASTVPTGVTLALTLPACLLMIGGNMRVTVRWAAIDPDSVIHQKAGLTAATGLILGNFQGTTLSNVTLRNSLFYKE